MNYITEILAFYDWLESNPISTSAISLWHALMYQANKARWRAEFSLAIKTLETRTGMRRGAIYTARNTLKQAGIIDFKERNGNQSAIYKLSSLCSLNEHNTDTNTNTTQTQSDTQERHNPEPLNKQNKTKKENNPLPPLELTEEERERLGFSPEMIAEVESWLRYKTERREGYKPEGRNKLLTQIRNNVEKYGETAVIDVIVRSMASNYQGITFAWLKEQPVIASQPDENGGRY